LSRLFSQIGQPINLSIKLFITLHLLSLSIIIPQNSTNVKLYMFVIISIIGGYLIGKLFINIYKNEE
jgi:hypothetical protein